MGRGMREVVDRHEICWGRKLQESTLIRGTKAPPRFGPVRDMGLSGLSVCFCAEYLI